jgi:FkbM family methyltransferase
MHGRLVWVHPRARFSYSTRTFFTGELHVQAWLARLLKPGHIVFDVGAHHGWVSMWTLPLVGSKGAVYSFEPSPANLSILGWHRQVNRFTQWTIIPRAVSDKVALETCFFVIDSGDSPMNSLTSGIPGTALMDGRDIGKINVQTTTLDAFCAEAGARPNLVKIDVEGAELLVLRGAKRLLGESHPTLILAIHPYWLPTGQSPAQILDLLRAYGYILFDSKGQQVSRVREGEYLCVTAKPDFVALQ